MAKFGNLLSLCYCFLHVIDVSSHSLVSCVSCLYGYICFRDDLGYSET